MKQAPSSSAKFSPLLFVVAAAVLWSTGGLFIKWTSLSGLELSFGRSLLAAITVAIFTRREGFGLNRVTALASVLYAALLLLFVLATKETTAANAIFLQYTAPVYLLIFEPLFYKEKFRSRDLIVVAACAAGMSLFFVGKAAPAGRDRQSVGACFRTLFRVLLPVATTYKIAGSQSRFLRDLWKPAACSHCGAGGFESAAENDIARYLKRDLFGRGANRFGLYALHCGDGARRALARRGNRRLHRAGVESYLGVFDSWRAAN